MNSIKASSLIKDNEFDVAQAISYQRAWSQLVKSENETGQAIKVIAGVDVAYDYNSKRAFAVAVALDAHSLALLEVQRTVTPITSPYRSGFLSFRETPAMSSAIERLSNKPDLLICDGQGLAHPRRFGLACHLGLLHDIPTIGCGKSRLYGSAQSPGVQREDFSYLYDPKGVIIGCVLRTRAKVKPVYISVGHKISLSSACQWIVKLTPKYRLPETTRLADRYAREHKLSSLKL